MKIQNHIMKFVADGGDSVESLFKSFKDLYNHALSKQGVKGLTFEALDYNEKEKAVNEAMIDEIIKRAQLPAEARQNLASFANHPNIGWATFAVISNLVDSVMPVSLDSIIGNWAEIQYNPGYGNVYEFRTRFQGFLKVTKFSRGKRLPELQRTNAGVFTLTPELHALAVDTDLYRLLMGIDSIAELAILVSRSMAQAIANETLLAFEGAVAALPTGAGGLSVSGYTQNDLMDLAARIQAWTGIMPMVVGTRVALSAVIPDTASPLVDLSSSYVQNGYLTTAFGLPMFVLPQAAGDVPYTGAISDNYIYIIPADNKPVKVAVGGEMTFSDSGRMFADLRNTVGLFKEFAVGVPVGSVFGAIELV